MRRLPVSDRSLAGNAHKRINCQDGAMESSGFMIDKYNQCTCNIAGMLVFCCSFLDEKCNFHSGGL